MTYGEKRVSVGHHKETHGMRDDITENTPLDDVKAPNVFERAKEEVEAIISAVHPKKTTTHETSENGVNKDHLEQEKSNSSSEPDRRTPKFIEKAKENIEKMMSPDHHHKETHGVSDDIDENTSIDEIKAPNIFERAKEEIEAVIQTFIPEKGQN